ETEEQRHREPREGRREPVGLLLTFAFAHGERSTGPADYAISHRFWRGGRLHGPYLTSRGKSGRPAAINDRRHSRRSMNPPTHGSGPDRQRGMTTILAYRTDGGRPT